MKGGGGSGDVTVSHVRNLYDGLKEEKGLAEIYEPLADFYRENVKEQYAGGAVPGMTVEPEVPAELFAGAAGVYGHGPDCHQPFFRRGLGPEERSL